MFIDDLADRPHDCDLLLDQNFYFNAATRYEGLVQPSCTKLLGPEYVLLRPEFLEANKGLKARTGEVRRIFIYFGGADLENLTGRALEALSVPELQYLDADVVIGDTNPNRSCIKKLVAKRKNTYLHIQIENIADIMATADLALGSGGSNTWERIFLRLPIITITVAENQVESNKDLHSLSAIHCIGHYLNVTQQDLTESIQNFIENPRDLCVLAQSGLDLVDGEGINKIICSIKALNR